MATFASEVARDILSAPAFWADMAALRAVGIRSTISAGGGVRVQGPHLGDGGDALLARLLTSAGVLANAEDDESKDLAQQIAVFGSLASDDNAVRHAAVDVLAGLGNFRGLRKLERQRPVVVGLHTYLRRALLADINSVHIGDSNVPLTEFQLDVWDGLQTEAATAISAPTSAGKSYVVLEHLCEVAAKATRFTALYLAPTRALLSEIQGKLERRLAPLGETVRITTIPVVDPAERPRQIYVLTQERAQLLLASVDATGLFDLVVVDEAQAIGDDSRGMILQDVLEKLKAFNQEARFLFLAPGASGFQVLGDAIGLGGLTVMETTLSPVVQNRIGIKFFDSDEHRVDLQLVTPRSIEPIGTYVFPRGFALTEDLRLAACALEFGSTGRSLVYATGAKNAEVLSSLLALSLPAKESAALEELASFIEEHVHKRYSLSAYVRRGVAFHYGNMPSLLREAIEAAFRESHLDYLCCTTTLFQGVNLPARNVFIDTPTRGNRGDPLDEAALWNFAGRAGRLGEEVVGNVFLVNYDKWDSQPLTTRRPFAITVAFKEAVESDFDGVLALLEAAADEEPEVARTFPEHITSAAGLVLFRSSQGTLQHLLGRQALNLTEEQKLQLGSSSRRVLKTLGLPETVLTTSWMINPLALSSLLARLRAGIKAKQFDRFIPVNPSSDAYNVYNHIIRRLYKHLGGLNLTGDDARGRRSYVSHVTVTALKWMRGEPLSQLVAESVKYKLASSGGSRRRTEQSVIDAAIRDMFTLVEQTIRFKLVQWGKAYVDLLKFVLLEAGDTERAAQVYDFSLALELGVSTSTGRSLMELGLSRITASAMMRLITDSSLGSTEVKAWILDQPESLLRLSPPILSELRGKGLLLD